MSWWKLWWGVTVGTLPGEGVGLQFYQTFWETFDHFNLLRILQNSLNFFLKQFSNVIIQFSLNKN